MYRACLSAVVGVAVYRSRCGDRVQGGGQQKETVPVMPCSARGRSSAAITNCGGMSPVGPDTVTGCGTEAEAVVVGGIAA